jgi:hypothetical protein
LSAVVQMLKATPFQKLRLVPSWPMFTPSPSLRLWKKYLQQQQQHRPVVSAFPSKRNNYFNNE